MREEEIAKLPRNIEAWRVREFLESLGITHSDVFDLHIGVRSVEARLYASDEKGHRFLDPDGKNAAEHVISIPLVGNWEKPKLCQSASRSLDGSSAVCELAYGHAGDHQGADTKQNNRLWADTDLTRKDLLEKLAPEVDKTLYEAEWPEPERCDNRGPDDIQCQHGQGHNGTHQLGSVYWR